VSIHIKNVNNGAKEYAYRRAETAGCSAMLLQGVQLLTEVASSSQIALWHPSTRQQDCFFPLWGEVEPNPQLPSPGWRLWWWVWSNRWNDWKGKPKYSEKTYSGAVLSTTNPTLLNPGSNPGPRGGEPETNGLSDASSPVTPIRTHTAVSTGAAHPEACRPNGHSVKTTATENDNSNTDSPGGS
jgi:hypothetical protein